MFELKILQNIKETLKFGRVPLYKTTKNHSFYFFICHILDTILFLKKYETFSHFSCIDQIVFPPLVIISNSFHVKKIKIIILLLIGGSDNSKKNMKIFIKSLLIVKDFKNFGPTQHTCKDP